MKIAALYLITGSSHLANLAVSLVSLRRHWQGDILVYAWPQSYDIAKRICEDPRIRAIPIQRVAGYSRKNAQEIDKIALIQKIDDYDMIVYLDADTIIRHPVVAPLALAGNTPSCGFAAVQFCDWVMAYGIPRRRVERLRGIEGIDQDCVEAALKPQAFSFNSGIFATSPKSPVLPVWGDWTYRAKHVYISGETALHPIAQKFDVAVMPGGIYNCSPIFQPKNVPDSEVGIWHFHGDCNTRPGKSPKGVAIWFPEFMAALRQNIGGLSEWWDQIGNEYLGPLVQDSVLRQA